MAGFKVEFSFFTNNGYSDFVDVTDDVMESGISSIKKTLDSNEYDVGALKFNKMKLTFRNEHGRYSEAIRTSSIFPEKRDETVVRISWSRNEDGISCGSGTFCGLTYLSQERNVFKGLLEDNSTKFDTDKQSVVFNILGIESIIYKVETPYSSLTGSDTIEDIAYKCLNQAGITKFFTVDAGNINVNYNFVPDDITSLEDRTVLETLNEILFLAGAVLFVENDIVYIRSRVVDPTSSYTFYSPSSDLGIENIINIKDYTLGLNRCFNFWVWKGSTVKQKFVDSVERYGLRKKEVDSELVTDTGKQTAILLSLITEFGFPKVEFNLEAPLYTEIIDLEFLNKVNIDYPADFLPVLDQEFSRYSQARYGQGNYARSVSSLFIPVDQDWKISNTTIDIRNSKITFRLREV